MLLEATAVKHPHRSLRAGRTAQLTIELVGLGDGAAAQKKDNNNAFPIFLYKQSPMIGILKPEKCNTALGHTNGIRIRQRTDNH